MESVVWKLKDLRQVIEQRGGERRQSLLDALESIGQSLNILAYHTVKVRSSVGDLLQDDPDPISAFKFLFGIGSAKAEDQKYNEAFLIHQAHLVAAIHSARGMVDMLAQVLNGLLLQAPLAVHDVTVSRVKNQLPDSPVKEHFANLQTSDAFRYINAFINTIKHRALIKPRFSISTEEQKAGVQVSAFDYNGDSFPVRWDDEVLASIKAVVTAVITTGAALNMQLEAESA